MRKYLVLTLAIVLAIFLFVPIGMASDTPSIEHYSVSNGTGAAAITYVSVTTIIPGKHRLLGFTVCPITSGAGTAIAGVYDAAAAGSISSTNLFGEKGGANTASYTETFPGPMDITNGIAVYAGSGTSVTLYYERSRP